MLTQALKAANSEPKLQESTTYTVSMLYVDRLRVTEIA